MVGALAGVRVLEFSQVVAAPFCGMLLADLGAEVIKVEPVGGEPWRAMSPFAPFESRRFISLNRGKQSLPLDITTDEGRRIVDRLLPTADVLIINYRPDVPARYGLDYETLAAAHPRLIYAENTAFGRRGPERDRTGYDLIIQALSGLVAAENKVAGGIPQAIGSTTLTDYVAGALLAGGILAALFVRERTGRGQKVESSLLGAALAIQTSDLTSIDAVDAEWLPRFLDDVRAARARGATWEETSAARAGTPARQIPWNYYYRIFRTADSYIAVGCLSDGLRRKLLGVLGLTDPRYEDPAWDPAEPASQAASVRLVSAAEACFAARPTAEWLRRFDAAGVPAGPVRFVEELQDDPQALANDLVVELEHDLAGRVRLVGPPIAMSGTPTRVRSASPVLGADTERILSGIGYDAAAIAELRAREITR